ncbi:MAG: hypothetical protein KGI75_18620 [Rhizobiaceae bacterium]|nr:hypothetical protein [Rhizobiaceae bacterium]
MNWINRYIDHPLLDGAAASLRKWHAYTGLRPAGLEPAWNILVLFFVLVMSGRFLQGYALILSVAAIIMLALPSAARLVSELWGDGKTYGAREYKALRARALSNRETQWTLRLMVLIAAACLPFFAHITDPTGAAFMLGASLWFVLTVPFKVYLDAAEPPTPGSGDRAFRGQIQFG